MVMLRLSVVCAACFLLPMVLPAQATAQLLNPPSGDAAKETAKSGGVATAQLAQEKTSGVKQTNWYSVPMPKITMPKIEIPRFHMPSFGSSGSESSVDKPSMFAPLTAGAHKIGVGSKKAWEGTKEMFRFGRGGASQQATQASLRKKPSLWERMFTPKEPEGPRTVAEWMAQPRLDP